MEIKFTSVKKFSVITASEDYLFESIAFPGTSSLIHVSSYKVGFISGNIVGQIEDRGCTLK